MRNLHRKDAAPRAPAFTESIIWIVIILEIVFVSSAVAQRMFDVEGLSPSKQATPQPDLDESTVPGTPTSLILRQSSDSVTVTWAPPSERNVKIRTYIVGYGAGMPDLHTRVVDFSQRHLIIRHLQPSTEYVISVRAANNIGNGRPIYAVLITSNAVPEPMTPMMPPIGLKANVLSPHSIILMWSDNTLGHNQRITDNRYYTVRYSPRGSQVLKQVNSTLLYILIDDLTPSTEYEFAVKVTKGQRQSAWSMSVFNMTSSAAPSSAPRQLTIAESITLSWQPPLQPNGPVKGYLVFYTTNADQNDRDWLIEGVMGDNLSTTIHNLTPKTTYYFKDPSS